MILVTGATGTVGRHVVRGLLDAGEDVRAVTRDPRRANFPAGVEVVAGDLLDAAAHDTMLAGVDSVFLFPVSAAAADFTAAARRAGVRRAVVLSSLASGGEIGDHHRAVEQVVKDSGMAWTFVRPGAFMANLRRQWGRSIQEAGVVRNPYGDASLAPIHEADIADVAIAALLDGSHAGQAYDVTGPESLTFREQAARIGTALGRDIEFVELPPERAREEMSRYMPDSVTDALLDMWAGRVGVTAPVSSVERVTGRPGRTLEQWVTEHTDNFR